MKVNNNAGATRAILALAAGLAVSTWLATPASAVNFPVLPEWRSTAEQVAQAGVPLSELAPDAPDSYTVRRGDTLWGISGMFLRTPWRWPELWGMNLEDIRNPHLIFPGQVLYLERVDGRARLRLAQPVGAPTDTVRLSPRTRISDLPPDAIASVPLHLIEPFLNEAVIFNENELAQAPRIVAAPENRVLLTRGDRAYVLGEFGANRDFRVFRTPRPLRDPGTKEVLGYEAVYLGTAELVAPATTSERQVRNKTVTDIVPASFTINTARSEMGIGDRLAPLPPRDFVNYVPRAPQSDIRGQVASVYGEALAAGQNQIVALNRGQRDGLENGHVLILENDGALVRDTTSPEREMIRLPQERKGYLFVFRVFDRMSYALILSATDAVRIGDRFGSP